jgi:hypothetical protein
MLTRHILTDQLLIRPVSSFQVCGRDSGFSASGVVKRTYGAARSLETGRCWGRETLGPQVISLTIFTGNKLIFP